MSAKDVGAFLSGGLDGFIGRIHEPLATRRVDLRDGDAFLFDGGKQFCAPVTATHFFLYQS